MIFKAIIAHSKPEDSFESHFKNPFAKFDIDYALKRARGKTLSAFLEWAWRIFLLLKLHIKDYPNNNEELTDNLSSFHPVPNIITDCDMFVICKGYEGKNPFALYLTIMMSKIGHSYVSKKKVSSINQNLIFCMLAFSETLTLTMELT